MLEEECKGMQVDMVQVVFHGVGGVLDGFFCKQKTADEMLRSLVGSEMCIRDRCKH